MDLSKYTKWAGLCLLASIIFAAPSAAQTPFACVPPTSPVVDSSLVAWWALNGTGNTHGTNTFVPDCSGKGVNGVFQTTDNRYPGDGSLFYWGPENWDPGEPGSGVIGGLAMGASFLWNVAKPAAIHNWVQIPSVTIPGQFTISAFASAGGIVPSGTTVPPGYPRIIELGTYASGVYLGGNGSSQTSFSTADFSQSFYGGGYQVVISNSNMGAQYGSCQGGTMDSEPHLVTATFDGQFANLYVDAVRVAGPCSMGNGPTNYPVLPSVPVSGRIGTFNNSPSVPKVISGSWYGCISDVRLYDRPLSQSEIEAILVYDRNAWWLN